MLLRYLAWEFGSTGSYDRMTPTPSSPLVSVLMPCHNSARWLRPAIESALNQSIAALELFVIDNGSTDETASIAEGYAARDPRVFVIRQGDVGPAIARNRARAVARGVWIATLDSDDIAEPTRLAKQLEFAASHPAVVLLGTGFVEITEDGARLGTHSYPATNKALLRRLERLQGFFPHSSAFYSRAVADRLGGYRVEVAYAEDWDFWLRLAEIGELASLPEPLVRIRKHPGQMSQDGGGRPQLVHACASAIGHVLRVARQPDPIAAPEQERTEFLNWVENRMTQFGYFEQRRIWASARSRAIGAPNRAGGLAGFAMTLARSPHGPVLLRDKMLGSELPRKLAVQWQERHATSVSA